ncbi:uncharacterized protein LOC129342874 [Eublepharis macularius]|uniref:Uncharacterized protein LOC129342874 n=1 Tax=Eublepharis macularius TaxID=481883 RepID=A0AA97KDB4_EUBMA|nr:uncharacterized protein LOC129342874 [Eublepharis macularius]XP_054854797.1 uncharacterized protein LOC129342874 [Eublepharis macularius]XP_054854798.1 uncharacterized protein LOC129342874 [Eublepharis macularius]
MGGKNSTQLGQNVVGKNTLDIAVTGVTGSGKSTLVNALRGLSDCDEGAAKTGVCQTTMEPMCYPHPTFPNVTIWDLPGIGAPNFMAREYPEKVNFSQYDFFIIVGCHRFSICDIQLCRAVQKMGKRFYYIRSKVDYDIHLEKRKPHFSEETTLQCIRKHILENLVKVGASSAEVFLISVWDYDKYDFLLLRRTLENEINELRRHVLRPDVLQDSEKRKHDRSTETSGRTTMSGERSTSIVCSESKGGESLSKLVATTPPGLNVLEKNTLDFAVTGVSGAGKSSLVNALRGLSDFDEGAAHTDVIEGTTEPMGYPHPTFTNVTIWDLPGIGTPRFKAEEYLERVNYNQYDFFIIVSSDRFTLCDIQLSNAVQKMGKRFYYVRAKMDVSIKNEKIKPDFNEQATLQKVRKYCLENLVKAGIFSPEIFLISNWYQDKYDFPLLKRTLEKEISEEKHGRSTELSQNTGIYAFLSKAALTFDLAKLKNSIAQKCFEQVTADIRKELDELENAKLNIAITGLSGTGKSSLVNALRGMTDYETDAAKTGIMQTTMQQHDYPHPLFPNVTLWDLPGIGTPEFDPKDYLEKINFKKYDFFIIVSSDRFTVNDAMLAREIQKRKKNFYYVRSKMDVSIASESLDPNFNMEKTIENLRKYCCENLVKAGELSPRVFLISRRDLSMYDFPLLQEALEHDLDDLKKHAFITSLPVLSREILKKKKAAMEDLIWKVAITSANISMIPDPGFSLVCDVNILVATLKLFYKVFGLDEDSLHRVAEVFSKEYQVLKSAVKKSPMSSEITPNFVNGLLNKSRLCVTVLTIQPVLDFIPLLGFLTGGASSFITTFYMLKSFLSDIVEDAENVRAKAAEP